MTKEAIKQALQYIEANAETQDEHEIAEGLRQVIAEAEKQDEPVAWGMEKDGLIFDVICPEEHAREEGGYTIPLYTTPQLETKDESVRWIDNKGKMILRKPRLDLGADYERGFIDGMQYQMQSSVDKAVNAMGKREWVGLTDEEIYEIYEQVERKVGEHWNSGGTTMMFPITLYKATEAKLKDKNT